ncbi:Ig-like domain-containing protein [Peptoniphilus genitalis]|uniref:Ig-like domain-containing protein n=1 Tax=Peptoniphilus genitalis TaxID=3036303 RepID=UPI0024ACB1F9|nr:Ig-like domain-containing protein [Peptoniphilus sp. Marseille-Q7072]
MNSTKQRLMTLLLAFLMIITSLPLNVLAASGVSRDKKEITDIKTVGDKQVINLGNVRGEKQELKFFSRSARLFGATNQQARSSSETVAQNVEISLDTLGLNLGNDQFDPSALTEVGSFDVKITFQEVGGRTETRTMTFQAGETKKTETFYLPKDFGQGVVKAEIPKLKDTISLRVYVGANRTTNFNLGQDMTYKFELTQIIHPVIDLKVVDPYGKELQENINQDLGLKLALEDEHEFNLLANTKTFNIRTLADFAGDDIADLNEVGSNPTLSLTTELDANKKLKVGDKTYKLNKITYNAIGQEVEINGQKKKVGGYIEFATQPKIIVPTPDDEGNLPKTPDGYKRLSFHAETKANANDGKFENGEKLKVIDVLEGTKFNDKELLASIAKVKNPTPLLNGSPDDNKKFLKWNPAIPTAETEGQVADTDFWPVYLKDGGEITPGEKLPDGVFEVKVIKDDTIAEDALYGKSYGVFQGSKLARDKFPDLEAAKGHQNPKWTTEADAPATDMVDIVKPWTKVITKATTFKATAAEKAATLIGKDGLKAVDTTALQGQELDEKFWHEGVALADNTPEDKKEAFAALLKDATVTDKSSRTTAEAGDKVGTLLVTFKDGSTLEVPNQKLIVKPNTVEISFDNEANDDANAPRHKETVVKGKVKSTSGYPVKGAVVEIKDEAGKVIGITKVIDDEGNFTAGTRELKAGEKLTASVTLPDSKLAAESTPKTVKLNADRLKDLLPIAKTQKENFSKKQNAIIEEKLEALGTAITEAEKLVDEKGKAKGEDTAKNQTAIDEAVTKLENALKALTANIPPTISGPKTHEIFVGEDLDLKALVDVTDGDGVKDLVEFDGSKVQVKAVKVEGQTETPVTNLSTIKDTVGTYKVTYTAKDKSNAEVTHEMKLTVKPRTTSSIEVTSDPSNMSYLITKKDGKAQLDLTGMTLNLVDNLGKKTKVELTDPKVKFKVNDKEIKNGGELTLADDVHFIEVEYTPEGSQTPLKAQTKGVLRVGPDYDNDGTDDRTQDFDAKNIEKLEVIKQPQLDYIAKDKSEDSKFKLNLEGMIVRMTDKAGKEKLALVKEDGKFVDYDDTTKEIKGLTATPAHGATLTPQTSDTDKGHNGSKVTITGPNNSKAETEPLKVFYDANKDGEPDYGQKQKTPAPSAMARNVGENPQGTTVEGMATPGAVIKITDKDGAALTTEPTEVKAGPDGKYTATIKPILADGTDIKVTAKLGEMGESDPTPTTVFDDKNNNKQPDRDEGFNIAKATDIKFVDQPDLTYLVPSKDKEVTFDGKDGKGKAIYLELSYKNGDKTESKIMTLEDLMKDTEHIAVTPAKGTTDKKENQAHDLVGKNIEVKLKKANPEAKATSTTAFAIEIDADGNGKADKDETTATPTVTARNIGKDPQKTTVEGTAPKGSTVTIKYTPEGGQETTKTVTAGDDGKYTAEITPKLEAGKEVKVTAKDGEKKVSPEVKTQVFDDKDNDGKDDKSQNFDITKADKIEMVYDPAKMNYLVTSEDGKVALETKGMVVKVTDKAGVEKKFTAEEIAKDAKNFTVEPKEGTEIGLDNNGKPIKVTLNVEGATTKEATTSNLSVKLDKDGNGVDDEKEQFDIKKATKVEILQNPYKMNYSVTEKKGKTPFDAKGVIIRLTDASGKTATYNYDDIIKDENKGKFTISPADKDEIGLKEDGSVNTIPFTVTVTGADTKPSVTAKENITVILDKDGNGVDDRTETTPEPDVIARNIGTDGPDGKKVPATKTTVEIETEPNADVTIEYKDANNETQKIVAKANDQGKLTKEITPKLEKDTPVKVTVQDGEKKPTDKTVKVFDDLDNNKIPDTEAGQTERPAAIASNIGKEPKFTTITGEAEKGATVTAKVGKEVVGTATADPETGKYTIKAKQNDAPIKEGVKIDVTATLAPKAESLKQTVVVFKDTDGDGQPDSAKDFNVKKVTGMQVVASPDKMVYSDGDELNLDGLRVLLTDVYGNQKIFTYNNAKNDEFTGAGLSVDYKQGDKLTNADNGKKLTVTLDTKDNKEVTKAITGETPTALTVNKKQSAQPTDVVAANQADEKVTKVKGKAVKDAVIKITDANGNNLLPEGTTIKADANGDFTADLKDLLDPGTKVIVTATESGKSESPKAETTVIRDKDGNWKADTGSKLSTPVIDPIREKDEKVVVEAPKADDKIQTIEVSDQNGKTVTLTKDPADKTGKTWKVDGSNDTVKENSDGKLEIPVKDKLPLNDRDQIKVTFKDGEKPANEAFDKAPVQKASQTPDVDPVYTGDKSVKIADPTKADPTAKTIKVKVGDNDSMTVEKQGDGSWKVKEDPNKVVKVVDGKIVVPLDPSAKKDEVIKVSTINDSGKASPAKEVTVVDKVETKKPTIDRANKDENSVSGKAAPNAEVTVTVTPKGGEPKTFTGKADGDGNYKVTTDPLVDGDTVVVKASEPGKADNTSDPKVVGVDTSKLKESIDKAEEIGGENGKDLKPDTNKVDKELKDALDEAKKVKDKGDNGDPNTNQAAVDKAKENLDKAIAQKEADKAVDKAKNAPTPENIGDAQNKIDAIPGSKDPESEDYNPIKKELQDKLDLIKKIKEGEDRLKQDDIKDKPSKDVDALKDAVEKGKKAIESGDNKTITNSTKEINDAIVQINKESIKVGAASIAVGLKTLRIRTSVPGATVIIKIDGVEVAKIVTDAYGTFSQGLNEGLEEDQEVTLEASKPGYNDGIFNDTVY